MVQRYETLSRRTIRLSPNTYAPASWLTQRSHSIPFRKAYGIIEPFFLWQIEEWYKNPAISFLQPLIHSSYFISNLVPIILAHVVIHMLQWGLDNLSELFRKFIHVTTMEVIILGKPTSRFAGISLTTTFTP